LFFSVIFVAVVCVMCRTVLFKVSSITVAGNNPYSATDVINACKLHKGENIIGMNIEKKEKEALAALPYAESVSIRAEFPTKITVTVVPARERLMIERPAHESLVISDKGKILGRTSEPNENPLIISVTGYTPEEQRPGYFLTECAEKDIVYELVDSLDKLGITKIRKIDVHDTVNIVLYYEERIEIRIGSRAEAEGKIRNAVKIIEDTVGADEAGIMRVHDLSKAFFEPKADVEDIVSDTAAAGDTTTAGAAGDTAASPAAGDTAEEAASDTSL